MIAMVSRMLDDSRRRDEGGKRGQARIGSGTAEGFSSNS
jgi:hypothetical protein